MSMRSSAEVRFSSRLSPEPTTGCLLWTGGAIAHGYGHFWNGSKPVLTHRFAWEKANRPLLDSECVLHKCDQPACCNPDHLYVGDKKQNALDRKVRARGFCPKGELHARRKLGEAEVQAICQAKRDGERTVTLARRYGVHRSTILKVYTAQTWTHLPRKVA